MEDHSELNTEHFCTSKKFDFRSQFLNENKIFWADESYENTYCLDQLIVLQLLLPVPGEWFYGRLKYQNP